MNKKIFKGIAILFLVSASGINVNFGIEKLNEFMPIMTASIEALADDESDCSDDEHEFTMCGTDEEGNSVECVACYRGSTDCSPTC
jgi:hypothetical protein